MSRFALSNLYRLVCATLLELTLWLSEKNPWITEFSNMFSCNNCCLDCQQNEWPCRTAVTTWYQEANLVFLAPMKAFLVIKKYYLRDSDKGLILQQIECLRCLRCSPRVENCLWMKKMKIGVEARIIPGTWFRTASCKGGIASLQHLTCLRDLPASV